MNNYCSNCGHALEGNERTCPECGYQLVSNRGVPSRRIEWNLVMKLNFTLALFISLTLILALSSVTGYETWYNYYSERYSYYLNEIAFGVGMFSLFITTLLSFMFFFINRVQFQLRKCSDQQWMITIFLFLLSLLIWIPYTSVWSQGNW